MKSIIQCFLEINIAMVLSLIGSNICVSDTLYALVNESSISMNGIASGYINGDDVKDIVYTTGSSGLDIYYLSIGEEGSVHNTLITSAQQRGIPLATADFDNNGYDDIVYGALLVMNYGGNEFIVTDHPFNEAEIMASDIDNDGFIDAVLFDRSRDTISLYHGNGDGTFRAPVISDSISIASRRLISGDFNHDGCEDIVRFTSEGGWEPISHMSILQSRAEGTFVEREPFYTFYGGSSYIDPFVDDLDDDGNPDIILSKDDATVLFRGDGRFNFSPVDTLFSELLENEAVNIDVNNDGEKDILLIGKDDYNHLCSVFYGRGGFQYSREHVYDFDGNRGNFNQLTATDINHDGKSDLFIAYTYTGTQKIYINSTIPMLINDSLPRDNEILPPFPNPFNSVVTIPYRLNTKARVSFTIHNISGQLIAAFIEKSFEPGIHTLIWEGYDDNGNNVSSGVYIITMKLKVNDGDTSTSVRKIMYLQ